MRNFGWDELPRKSSAEIREADKITCRTASGKYQEYA